LICWLLIPTNNHRPRKPWWEICAEPAPGASTSNTGWRITHAEQVVGQQMGAIRDQENSQLHSKKPMPAGRQLDG
jgi:hypothetical protein